MSDTTDAAAAPGWRFPLDTVRAIYAYDHDYPLEATIQPSGEGTGMVVERFAITSIHDQRVPGLLMRSADASGPAPALLIAHPATLNKASDYVLAPAEAWVQRGGVAVTMDQAGHGERAGRPLSAPDFSSYPQRRLAQAAQTGVDWMRVLDYLLTRPEVNAARIGFLGFSMGSARAAALVGLDARIRAAVFCIPGGLQMPAAAGDVSWWEEATHPMRFAPLMDRPTLIVAGTEDDVAPPEVVLAFYDAMPEPKRLEWQPCGHWDFMPQGLAPVWPFLHQLFDTPIEKRGARPAGNVARSRPRRQ